MPLLPKHMEIKLKELEKGLIESGTVISALVERVSYLESLIEVDNDDGRESEDDEGIFTPLGGESDNV